MQINGLCQIFSGIVGESYTSSLNLYPNPASTEIKIENSDFNIKEIVIYNIAGKPVFSQISNFKLQTAIDVSNLTSGAYFVKIKTKNFTEIKKLIIVR